MVLLGLGVGDGDAQVLILLVEVLKEARLPITAESVMVVAALASHLQTEETLSDHPGYVEAQRRSFTLASLKRQRGRARMQISPSLAVQAGRSE